MVVVLPAPLGPRKPVTDPGSTVNERSETARTGPNALLSSRTSTRTGPAVIVLPIEMGLSCRSAAGGRPSKRTGAVRRRGLRGPGRHRAAPGGRRGGGGPGGGARGGPAAFPAPPAPFGAGGGPPPAPQTGAGAPR